MVSLNLIAANLNRHFTDYSSLIIDFDRITYVYMYHV